MSSGAYDRGQQRAPAFEPRSPMLVLTYPHLRPSLEPKRLRREEIWAVAEEARRQLCRGPRPKVDVAQIARRSVCLQVNGLVFELRWQFDRSVEDEAGQPVVGLVEHDPTWPAGATISIDSAFIGERDELGRSTAAHELGHAVFDVPAWIRNAQNTTEPATRRRRPSAMPLRRSTGWNGAPTSSWARSWHRGPCSTVACTSAPQGSRSR